MNRDLSLLATIGITIGLLVVVLVAVRSAQPPTPGVMRRAGATALLVYAVLGVPVFVRGGLTAVGLLLVLLLLALPLLGVSASRDAEGLLEAIARAVVGVGLLTALLITAAQTLSLLGNVDPRVVVVLLATITAILVAGQGLAATGRVGSAVLWTVILPIVMALALGVLLGSPGDAVSPIVSSDGPAVLEMVGLAVAVLMLGAGDNGLRALLDAGGGGRSALRWSWGGAALAVLLFLVGLLMFFGGNVVAPSLQFFVVPANLDLLAPLAIVVLAVAAVLFAGLVATALLGVGLLGAAEESPAPARSWLAGGAVLAAVLALVDPGVERVLVVASLAGAALLGAQLPSGSRQQGVMAGLAVGIVGFGVLAVLGRLEFGVASIVTAVVVLVVAAATARVGGSGTAVPEGEASSSAAR